MGDAEKKAEILKNQQETGFQLIPGLPDDLAIECMVRVPYQFHSTMKSVCHSWRSLVSDPLFYRERRRFGKAEDLFCLVQPLTPSPPSPLPEAVEFTGDCDGEVINDELTKKQEDHSPQQRVSCTPLFGLSVYNKAFDTWHRIRLPGGGGETIPLFGECVSLPFAGKLLLIGGWDPATLELVTDVYVLDFAGEGGGRRWRRGAPMAVARSFFACAAVGSKKVYVAGGHDEQKNALRSAEVYDVEKDEWQILPPMEEGRDECHGMTVAGDLGFCVLSGYGTETQGRFRSDAEWYNPATNSWSKIENIWAFPDTCPRGRTAAVSTFTDAGCINEWRLWCFPTSQHQIQPRREFEEEEKNWKLIVDSIQLPIQIPFAGAGIFAASLGDSMVVMGGGGVKRGGECEGEGGLMMREGDCRRSGNAKWSHARIPSGFSSLAYSATSISI